MTGMEHCALKIEYFNRILPNLKRPLKPKRRLRLRVFELGALALSLNGNVDDVDLLLLEIVKDAVDDVQFLQCRHMADLEIAESRFLFLLEANVAQRNRFPIHRKA